MLDRTAIQATGYILKQAETPGTNARHLADLQKIKEIGIWMSFNISVKVQD